MRRFININNISFLAVSQNQHALKQQLRHQGWSGIMSGDNVSKHNKKIAQSDGVDDIMRVKAEQQRWLDHEQYQGYSDTYLKPTAKFKPLYEIPGNRGSGFGSPLNAIDEICNIVYSIYGEAADVLEELEANPLHPQFKEMLETARNRRVALEKKIDEIYEGAHPTIKTMYDSMLVKRWQTLEDWIKLVEKKRENTLRKVSPEWIEEIEKQKGIAEQFKSRLKHLGTAMEDNPVAFLEGSGFNEEEMALIERRKKFFTKQKTFGAAIGYNDFSPH